MTPEPRVVNRDAGFLLRRGGCSVVPEVFFGGVFGRITAGDTSVSGARERLGNGPGTADSTHFDNRTPGDAGPPRALPRPCTRGQGDRKREIQHPKDARRGGRGTVRPPPAGSNPA
ncbi:hypothetical protein HUN42_00061 [Streptomyces phage Dagobah]|nr:hypothetical protein HUN42_00061 [Streptomyces phage Dagobah]